MEPLAENGPVLVFKAEVSRMGMVCDQGPHPMPTASSTTIPAGPPASESPATMRWPQIGRGRSSSTPLQYPELTIGAMKGALVDEDELHPEWLLMYRKGLPFGLIATLCKAPRSTVHAYLRRQSQLHRELAEEHERNRPSEGIQYRGVPQSWVEHVETLKAFIDVHGRMPRNGGRPDGETALASWLSAQRRKHLDGGLRPEALELLKAIPDWEVSARALEDRQRWHQRLAELRLFLDSEGRWPRYRGYRSEDERVLGVWLHGQKQKLTNRLLTEEEVRALTDAAPGWDGVLRMTRRP